MNSHPLVGWKIVAESIDNSFSYRGTNCIAYRDGMFLFVTDGGSRLWVNASSLKFIQNTGIKSEIDPSIRSRLQHLADVIQVAAEDISNGKIKAMTTSDLECWRREINYIVKDMHNE